MVDMEERKRLVGWLYEIERSSKMLRQSIEHASMNDEPLGVHDDSVVWNNVGVIAGDIATVAAVLWPNEGEGPIE